MLEDVDSNLEVGVVESECDNAENVSDGDGEVGGVVGVRLENRDAFASSRGIFRNGDVVGVGMVFVEVEDEVESLKKWLWLDFCIEIFDIKAEVAEI